jgi:uncharacterized protein (DUF1499 family)
MRFGSWGVGVLALLVAAALAALVAGQAGLLRGRPPAQLGLRDGRLAAPSSTANSVSSQAALWPGHPQREAAQIDPLRYEGDGAAAMARLQRLLAGWPGAQVRTARADYLHASFETRWLHFTDDAEFWLDPSQPVIQVRSASRLGRRDFGVNRARIEAIRARFVATAMTISR